MRPIAIIGPVLLLGIVALSAQTPSAPVSPASPTFDVASIRPNLSGSPSYNINAMANGRLVATNVTVRRLIVRAHGLDDSQLIGGPNWLDVDRFDIDGRVESVPPGGAEAVIVRLRTLLADRFMLRLHEETRELPAYLLTLARKDGRLGTGIRPTEADCSVAPSVTGPDVLTSGKNGWPACGMSSASMLTNVVGGGVTISSTVRRSGIEMKQLATILRNQSEVARPVVDRTGLAGRFDLEYAYVIRRPPNQTQQPEFASVAPTIFVALEEQLGLKLESQRVAVPVLVVDSVQRPTEN